MINATRCRIAVVDDEASMGRALQRLLRLAGYDVETFASGNDFLLSLETQVPDCVVLDLHMPVVTGFDVQAQLGVAHPNVVVVVITGHDSPQARERVHAMGDVDYLRKPVAEDVLLEAIARGLARKRPSADNGESSYGRKPET